MKNNVVYLVTKHMDKNNSIQLLSDNVDKIESLYNIFDSISFIRRTSMIALSYKENNKYIPFVGLELFLQDYSIHPKNSWIMLESWSDKEDLMIEFGEFCAKELGLPFDII